MKGYFGEVVKSPWDNIKGGFLLGSDAFVETMKEKLERKMAKMRFAG